MKIKLCIPQPIFNKIHNWFKFTFVSSYAILFIDWFKNSLLVVKILRKNNKILLHLIKEFHFCIWILSIIISSVYPVNCIETINSLDYNQRRMHKVYRKYFATESQSGLLHLECTWISMQHYLSRLSCSPSNFYRPRFQPASFREWGHKGEFDLDFKNWR